MVFWWTGRGFLALLSLIGVFGAFGAVVTLTLGEAAFEAQPWLWGVGALLASGVNWLLGSRLNQKVIKRHAAARLADRLIYKARHRFMGLPMETWSIPMAALGCILIARGVLRI